VSKRLAVAGWTGLVGLLVAAVGISLFVGKMSVGPGEIGDLLLGRLDGPRQALVANLVWGIRWPRILAALACGAALAASGAAYQALLVNPLVSPGILGVLAGASFGAALAMLWSWSLAGVQAMAFACGLAAAGLAVLLAVFQSQKAITAIVLGGVISAAFFTALTSLVKYVADPYNQLPAIVYSSMATWPCRCPHRPPWPAFPCWPRFWACSPWPAPVALAMGLTTRRPDGRSLTRIPLRRHPPGHHGLGLTVVIG
jgi:iron complex transport system permease protein